MASDLPAGTARDIAAATVKLTQDDDIGGVPMSVWTPVGVTPRAIVLIGHGGSHHRRAEMVEMTARIINVHIPAYVVAIDGPVHGDRLTGEPGDNVQAFVRKWTSEDGGVPLILADWRSAITVARRLGGAAHLLVGYYGVSMGTAYGIPQIYPRAGSAHMAQQPYQIPVPFLTSVRSCPRKGKIPVGRSQGNAASQISHGEACGICCPPGQ